MKASLGACELTRVWQFDGTDRQDELGAFDSRVYPLKGGTIKYHPARVCGFCGLLSWHRDSYASAQGSLYCVINVSSCYLRVGYRSQSLAYPVPQWCLDKGSLGKREAQGGEVKAEPGTSPVDTSVDEPLP